MLGIVLDKQGFDSASTKSSLTCWRTWRTPETIAGTPRLATGRGWSNEVVTCRKHRVIRQPGTLHQVQWIETNEKMERKGITFLGKNSSDSFPLPIFPCPSDSGWKNSHLLQGTEIKQTCEHEHNLYYPHGQQSRNDTTRQGNISTTNTTTPLTNWNVRNFI